MSRLYAAFGEVELPCDFGTNISGWIPPERKMRFKIDPLYGNIAILKNDEKILVIISLDLLQIDVAEAEDMRKAIAEAVDTTYDAVMISATHNHCGPASVQTFDAPKDFEFLAQLKEILVKTTAETAARLEPAVWGTGFTYENDISFNRRYIMRNGFSFAHPNVKTTDVLCAEGPIDPQVGVICVRNMHGEAMGYMVNFACHPLYYGGQSICTANFPGVLRRELKNKEQNEKCVVLFINGAAGDISHANPFDPKRTTMESVGARLAERSYEAALAAPYSPEIELDARTSVATVNRRHISDAHIARAKQVIAGEDVVIDPSWHPVSSMPIKEFAQKLIELREDVDRNPQFAVPLQVLRIGETAWAAVPGELFVRLGMEIKLRSKIPYTYIATYTNGQIGYIGTPEAYARGGYETTPCGGSSAETDTGPRIVDAVSALLNTL